MTEIVDYYVAYIEKELRKVKYVIITFDTKEDANRLRNAIYQKANVKLKLDWQYSVADRDLTVWEG